MPTVGGLEELVSRSRRHETTKYKEIKDKQGKVLSLAKEIRPNVPKRSARTEIGPSHQSTVHKSEVIIRTQTLCWGFPLDEVIFGKWFAHFLQLRIMPWDDVMTSLATYLPDARNIIHKNFVRNSRCEWLIMLDSDVLPPPNFMESLGAHIRKDPSIKMIGGWYKKKSPLAEPVVYHQTDQRDAKGAWMWEIYVVPGEGLEEVDAAGAGCWLMHREIAEALGEEPYDMSEGGEDLTLCRKVRELGYKIYIDWDVACAHCGVSML